MDVLTYELALKNAKGTSGNVDIPADIEDRIIRLEHSVQSSRKEFYDKFETYDYINTIDTTAIKNQEGYTTRDFQSSDFLTIDKLNDFKKDPVNTTSDIFINSDGRLTCTNNLSRYETSRIDITNIDNISINCDSFDTQELGTTTTTVPTLSATLTKQFVQFEDNKGGKWTVWYRLISESSTEVNYKREYIDVNGVTQSLVGSKTIEITAPTGSRSSSGPELPSPKQIPVGNISFQIHENEDFVSISYSIGSASIYTCNNVNGVSQTNNMTSNYICLTLDHSLNQKFVCSRTLSRTTTNSAAYFSTIYLKMIPRGNAKVVILNNAYSVIIPGFCGQVIYTNSLSWYSNNLTTSASKQSSFNIITYAYGLSGTLINTHTTEVLMDNDVNRYKNFDVIKTANDKFVLYAQYNNTTIKRFEYSSVKNDDYTRTNTITTLSNLTSTLNPSDGADITSILTSKNINTNWYPRDYTYDGLSNMFIKDNVLYILSINITAKKINIAKYFIGVDGKTITFNPNTDIMTFSINDTIDIPSETMIQTTTAIQQLDYPNSNSNIIIKNGIMYITYIGINKLTASLQHVYYKTINTDLSYASNDYIINNSNISVGVVYSGTNQYVDNLNNITINRNMYNLTTPTFATDIIGIVNSSIQYQYKLSSNKTQWINFNKSVDLNNLNEEFIVIGANFIANTINNNFSKINKIIVSKTITEDLTVENELHIQNIPLVASSGMAVLNSDCDVNDGDISWMISYNKGINWTDISLGQEFAYKFNFTPDVNIKAFLKSQISATNKPIIRDVSLTSSSIQIHSATDENTANTLKTNIKLDKLSGAIANKMINMYVDTFNDTSGIDVQVSDFVYDIINKSVSGNIIESRIIVSNTWLTSIILVVDEDLKSNGRIDYYVSTDGGSTYIIIEKVDYRVSVIENKTGQLKIKAVLYNGASLNAWACSWC